MKINTADVDAVDGCFAGVADETDVLLPMKLHDSSILQIITLLYEKKLRPFNEGSERWEK
jgi:hypothetical protein